MAKYRLWNRLVQGILCTAIIILLSNTLTLLEENESAYPSNIEVNDPSSAAPGVREPGTRASPMVTITDSNVEYAIIAPQDFTAGLGELANWHSGLGIRTKVYSMTTVEGFPGDDLQQRIHNFLDDLNSTSPSLKYALLVGDHDLIPARYLWAGADPWNLDYSYISDNYYACLGGNWDANGNGIYGEFGEEDWTPDIYVGRIPIDNAGEVPGMVDKIINYRTSPPSGDWIKRMNVWTSVMVPPNGASYKSYKDNAFKIHQSLDNRLPAGMNKYYLADYTTMEGGNYTLDDDNFTRYKAKQQFDGGAALMTFAGQAFYDEGESAPPMDNALANYQGDGTANSWAISYNYDDCDSAANGGKLTFSFIASCDTLNFSETDDSNLERLNTKPTGGVISQIGCSGRSWRGEDPGVSRGNWWMIDKFWQLFFQNDCQPADAFYEMKMIYARDILPPFLEPEPSPLAHGIKCNLFGYNFLGDPALDIWTAPPKQFKNTAITLWEGNHWLNMTVEDEYSQPVPNARVTILLNGKYSSAVSDASGRVSVPYEMTMGDNPGVSFHANGIIPKTITANVEASPADLLLSGNIAFSNPTPGVGSDVVITALVRNSGDMTANAVKVGFYMNEFSGENLIDGPVDVSSISAGTGKEATLTWTATAGVTSIVVVVDPDDDVTESNEENNMDVREISVIAADLAFDVLTLSSSQGYNVSTIGSTTISIFTHNQGELRAENIRFNVYSEAVLPGNRIGQEFEVGYMDPGEETNVNIPVTPRAGYRLCLIVVDPDNTIPEMNETNNIITFYMFGNQPPVLSIGELENIELEPTEQQYWIDLEDAISDNDTKKDELNIYVTYDDREDVTVTFNPPFDIHILFEETFVGKFTLIITLRDGRSEIVKSINLSKAAINDPPVIDPIHDMKVQVGDLFALTVTVVDEDAANVSFSDDSPFFDIGPNSGKIEFIPGPSHIGSYLVTIRAMDPQGLDANYSFNLTVKKRYQAPELTGTKDLTAKLGEEFTFNVAYEVDEAWADDLNFSVTGPFVSIDDSGKVSFTSTKKMMDGKTRKEFIFTVTISDGKGEGVGDYSIMVIGSEKDVKTEEDSKSGKILTYVFIAVGAIVLIVLVIVVLVILKRKRTEAAMLKAWEMRRVSSNADKEREKKIGDLPGFGRPGPSREIYDDASKDIHDDTSQKEDISFMGDDYDGYAGEFED